jgi:hypothetical protein
MASPSKYSGEQRSLWHPMLRGCLDGIKKLAGPCLDLLWDASYFFINKKRGCFLLEGGKFGYFNHRHNSTNLNERSVEISIIRHLIKENTGKPILEIGNVLSHYFTPYWDIVDKYEKGPHVINQDVIDYKKPQKYGLIVSISTFEHIGYDEEITDNGKVIEAVRHVKNSLLTSDGLFVMTVPIGYNKDFDRTLFNDGLGFGKTYYFQRISADNQWQECEKKAVESAKYGSPYQWANAIAICATKRLSQ